MLDYEEELKKFKPSLEVDDIENAVYQEDLTDMTADMAREYESEGQFAPGSMLPKVQAAIKFVSQRPGKKSIITSLDKAIDALEGKTGTTITFS